MTLREWEKLAGYLVQDDGTLVGHPPTRAEQEAAMAEERPWALPGPELWFRVTPPSPGSRPLPRQAPSAVRPGSDWITATEAARLVAMTPRAVYAELARNPTGRLAQAASRLGRRLRFSRAGLDALLARPPLQRRVARGVVAPRVPSPTKGDR